VCPVKIDLHHELYAMRNHLDQQQKLEGSKKLSMRMTAGIFQRPALYRTAGRVARLALRWLPRFLVYSPLNMWGRQRELPEAPSKSFRELYDERHRKN